MDVAESLAHDDAEPPRQRWRWLRFIARDKKALVGLILLTVMLAAAILAPLIAPYDPNDMEYDMIAGAVLGASRWAPTTSAATC